MEKVVISEMKLGLIARSNAQLKIATEQKGRLDILAATDKLIVGANIGDELLSVTTVRTTDEEGLVCRTNSYQTVGKKIADGAWEIDSQLM